MAEETTTTIQPIKQIQDSEGTAHYIAAKYNAQDEEIDNTYLRLDGGTMTGPLSISDIASENKVPNPYLKLQTQNGETAKLWYIQAWTEGVNAEECLYIGGSASSGTANPIKISGRGNLTAKNIETDSINTKEFFGEWKNGSYTLTAPNQSGTVATTGDLNLTLTDDGDGPFVTDVSVSGLGVTLTRTDLEGVGLSTVYKYKGTRTWAELKQIASAAIGDVYSISDEDIDGNSNADWACYNEITSATGDNYASYWQSLGGKVNLSAYAIKEANNEFSGEQKMVHGTYCPTMYGIAGGIGCSLKNTRAVDNQAIIGEILLPTTNSNGDGTPNTSQVIANEMGVYIITSKGTDTNNNNYGKITGKRLIGKFTNKGWVGDVDGNAATATKLATAISLSIKEEAGTTGIDFDGTAGAALTIPKEIYDFDKITSREFVGPLTGTANRAKLLETYYADKTATYGDNWHLMARWHTGDRLRFEVQGNIAYPVEVDHAYKLASLSGNQTSCLLKVGDNTKPVYFSNGVPIASTIDLAYPFGFTSHVSKAPGWGTLTTANGYTYVTGWQYSQEGGPISADVVFAAKAGTSSSSSTGELSMQIDGYYYQHEGERRVLDTSNVSGTANYIPKFTDRNTIGNSSITDDGSVVTIGRQLIINNSNDTDKNTSSGALRIGNINSTHLSMDDNEIMAKNGTNAASTLYLNNEGGLVEIGTDGIHSQGLIKQGSTSNDSSIGGMNRYSADLFISGNGSAPNAPKIAGFYLGKSQTDENRHMNIVSGGDYSYIDFNKASVEQDFAARILVNVNSGLTEFTWGTTNNLTQKILSINGTLALSNQANFIYNSADKCIDITFN